MRTRLYDQPKSYENAITGAPAPKVTVKYESEREVVRWEAWFDSMLIHLLEKGATREQIADETGYEVKEVTERRQQIHKITAGQSKSNIRDGSRSSKTGRASTLKHEQISAMETLYEAGWGPKKIGVALGIEPATVEYYTTKEVGRA